ncbi:MAG: RDD family protein [Acidimicrobiales bacterium]
MAASTPSLVTPEAVVLELQTASVASRLLAVTIDLVLQAILAVVAVTGLFAAVGVPASPAGAGAAAVITVTAIVLGYPIAFETLWRGRTPGKAALGLRVVTTEGAPIRFRHAAVRGFLILVDLYLTGGAAAVVAILATRHDQRLGDLAAGTLVRRERSGASPPTSVRFPVPAGQEGYAATLDVSGLGPEEYGAVRSYLLRAASLPADARRSLAGRVAATVAARMRHQPPPEVDPETFLACVAAAHQAAARQAPAPSPTGALGTAVAGGTRPGGGGFAPPP